MKKLAVMFMCLAIMYSGAWAAYYDEGNDGDSWETAYVIDSVEDLELMKSRNETEKYYKLTADIDLSSETDWYGINFSGHFDGQNHTVRLNITNNDLFAGIFEFLSGNDSIIRNLNVTGNVKANCAGTIVHYLNAGLVENCSFTGTITYNSSGDSFGAGGLIAHMDGGTVRNCRVDADISGRNYAGGIAGEISEGRIENCTADVRLLSGTYRGGIVGYATDALSDNFHLSGNTWPNIGPSAYPQIGKANPDIPPDITWNNHRYQIYDENLTWEQAKAKCESLGGHLVTITSHEEQEFIERLLRNSDTNFDAYWLGARANESGWWHWVTDEVFERQYQDFAAGQPDGSGVFLAISELNSSSWKWNDVSDNGTERGFICEWDLEQPEVKTAQFDSDFADWLAHPENWRNDSTESYGALPSPIDTSHLRNNPPRTSSVNASAADDLPVSFDGRIEFGLPEARDQGGYDTCWVFASIGALEANYKAQKMTVLGDKPDLSELHVAWFVYRDPSSKYYTENSSAILNKQGNADKVRNFLNRGLSPVNEADMKYSEAGNDAASSNAKIEAFLNGRTASDFKKV